MAKKKAKKKTAKRKSKVTKRKVTKKVTKRKVIKRRFINPEATDFELSGHVYNSKFGMDEQDAWDRFIANRLKR